jgi:hypothetical protein
MKRTSPAISGLWKCFPADERGKAALQLDFKALAQSLGEVSIPESYSPTVGKNNVMHANGTS